MIDIKKNISIDIDDMFGVHDFKALIYDDGYFFLIANKRNNKLGFFLLKISEERAFS